MSVIPNPPPVASAIPNPKSGVRLGLAESSLALGGAAGSGAEFSKSAGEEDSKRILPTRSSMYCATLSWARRIRSLPASDCCNTGSIRFRQASLWRAASFDLRRITSQPGHPVVSPTLSKSDRRSCVCRGTRSAGSSWKAGGSDGTGSTWTGARIPMRASPGRRPVRLKLRGGGGKDGRAPPFRRWSSSDRATLDQACRGKDQ